MTIGSKVISLSVALLASLSQPQVPDIIDIPFPGQDYASVGFSTMSYSIPWKPDGAGVNIEGYVPEKYVHDYFDPVVAQSEADWWFMSFPLEYDDVVSAFEDSGYEAPIPYSYYASGEGLGNWSSRQYVALVCCWTPNGAPPNLDTSSPDWSVSTAFGRNYALLYGYSEVYRPYGYAPCSYDDKSVMFSAYLRDGFKIPSPPPSGEYFGWLYNMGTWLVDNVFDFAEIFNFEAGPISILNVFGFGFGIYASWCIVKFIAGVL